MNNREYNVLIIEDDKYKYDRMKNALMNNGVISIDHEETAVDALHYLSDETNVKPDFIILDMQFPKRYGQGVDKRCGLFVLEELERLECRIPVIMCSSGYYDIPDYLTDVVGYIVFDYSRDYTEIITAYLEKVEDYNRC